VRAREGCNAATACATTIAIVIVAVVGMDVDGTLRVEVAGKCEGGINAVGNLAAERI